MIWPCCAASIEVPAAGLHLSMRAVHDALLRKFVRKKPEGGQYGNQPCQLSMIGRESTVHAIEVNLDRIQHARHEFGCMDFREEYDLNYRYSGFFRLRYKLSIELISLHMTLCYVKPVTSRGRRNRFLAVPNELHPACNPSMPTRRRQD